MGIVAKLYMQKGNVVLIAVVGLAVLFGGAAFWYASAPKDDAMVEKDTMIEQGDAMMKEGDVMVEHPMEDGTLTDAEMKALMEKDAMMKDDSMMEKGDAMKKEDSASSFTGTVLAGTESQYLAFTKADYDKAMSSGKTVLLYFYANWCPTCKAEQPVVQGAFNELKSSQVVGFRVNYNDNETDAAEQALAKEHGVAYQHTKVIVKNGERVLKSPESWTKDRYLSEIAKVTN